MCAAAAARYKCPVCGLRTCSAACSTAHKPSCAPAPASSSSTAATLRPAASGSSGAAHGGGEGDDDDDDGDWLLPAAALARMGGDAELVQALRDPRLQRVLRVIDGAADRRGALERALTAEGAPLRDLVDRMLIAVGACSRDPATGAVVFIGGKLIFAAGEGGGIQEEVWETAV